MFKSFNFGYTFSYSNAYESIILNSSLYHDIFIIVITSAYDFNCQSYMDKGF